MIINGDSKEELKKLDDNSIDAVITDPPYGYSFMGKDWDKALPDIEIFKQCLRVLKPGAFAMVMAAPRQDVLSRMMILLEEAGFNIDFTSIYWTYASGFPKANNIGKKIDKMMGNEREVIGRNPNSRESCDKTNTIYESGTVGKTDHITKGTSEFEGSYGGCQLKPAVEVIVVAQKPPTEPTQAGQALANGKGITYLDNCRIPYADDGDIEAAYSIRKSFAGKEMTNGKTMNKSKTVVNTDKPNTQGRFPANLLVSDDVLDDGKITKSPKPYQKKHAGFRTNYVGGEEKTPKLQTKEYGDSGTYSRFFSLDAWAEKNLPFLIVPKASKKEKNAGCEWLNEKPNIFDGRNIKQRWCKSCGKRFDSCKCGDYQEELREVFTPVHKNHHPTVKPVKLMSYLITMTTRPGDVVLDPFAGSFTTGVAAKMLGRDCICIEMDKDYAEIGKARINNVQKRIF